MKKLLIVAATLVVVVGGSALAVQHYNKYQNKTQAETQVAVDQNNAKLADLEQQVVAVKATSVAETQRLSVECQKGAVAYAKLSPAVKAQTPAPVCSRPTR